MKNEQKVVAFFGDGELKHWKCEGYYDEVDIGDIEREFRQYYQNVYSETMLYSSLPYIQSASDIAEEIGNELEDANHHSISGLPEDICHLLKKHVGEQKAKEIMHDMRSSNMFFQ